MLVWTNEGNIKQSGGVTSHSAIVKDSIRKLVLQILPTYWVGYLSSQVHPTKLNILHPIIKIMQSTYQSLIQTIVWKVLHCH